MDILYKYKKNKADYLDLTKTISKIKNMTNMVGGSNDKNYTMYIILPRNTTGLMNDALIFSEYFKKYIENLDVTIISPDHPPKQGELYADIVLYLELLFSEYIEFLFNSKYCMFMINQEFFYYDVIKKKIARHSKDKNNKSNSDRDIDMYICKTKEGVRFLEELMPDKKSKIFYTKFTTIFPTISTVKDYSKFFHGAGSSKLKGTDVLLNTWGKYQGLPNLVVSCYEGCFDNLKQYSNKDVIENPSKFNITLLKQKQSYDDIVKLKNIIGYHLCPSMAEGYGHYLNEARIVSAVTLTLNAPPMNEIIDDSCGILIPYTKKIKKDNSSDMYITNEENILQGIKRMQSLTDEQKRKMGENARKKYEEDTDFFSNKIRDLSDLILDVLEKN
jgi:hypothetical protein